MSDSVEQVHTCSVDGEQKLTAEGELAVARLALDSGDLPHAATHLGYAMAEAPQLPEAHEALTEFAARADSLSAALELFPDDDGYIGIAACRAHLLAAAGRWDEAVGLLAAMVGAQPEGGWTQAAWLARPDLATLVRPDALAAAVARIVGGGLPDRLTPELAVSLRPFLDLVTASIADHPRHPALLTMASGLARRFAEHEQAIAWARAAQEIEPGHVQAVMLGYAMRAAGQIESALAVWEAEIARDPADLSLYVDVAELYAGTGRAAEGVPWLERAVAVEPLHAQAAPALHGLRFDADGDRRHLVALVDLSREHPELDYAGHVLARSSHGLPWLAGVTGAREATINVMHQVMEDARIDLDQEIDLATSQLEAPSAVLTLQRLMPHARVRFETVSDPDPRLPLRGAALLVWRYEPEGKTALPVPPEPSAEASEAVRAVAAVRWRSVPEAYDRAVALAGVTPEDLIGVLAHPPQPREDEQGRYLAAQLPELWIRGVQTFACLGVAHHGVDEPWQSSRRRQILLDLLNGPEDWVTEAAGFALVAVAWGEPATREDIGARLAERMMDAAEAAQSRPAEVLDSLCHFVRACPWLPESVVSLAVRLSEQESEQSDEAEVPDQAEEGEDGSEGREKVKDGGSTARDESQDASSRGPFANASDSSAPGQAGKGAGPAAGAEMPAGDGAGEQAVVDTGVGGNAGAGGDDGADGTTGSAAAAGTDAGHDGGPRGNRQKGRIRRKRAAKTKTGANSAQRDRKPTPVAAPTAVAGFEAVAAATGTHAGPGAVAGAGAGTTPEAVAGVGAGAVTPAALMDAASVAKALSGDEGGGAGGGATAARTEAGSARASEHPVPAEARDVGVGAAAGTDGGGAANREATGSGAAGRGAGRGAGSRVAAGRPESGAAAGSTGGPAAGSAGVGAAGSAGAGAATKGAVAHGTDGAAAAATAGSEDVVASPTAKKDRGRGRGLASRLFRRQG